MFKLTSSDYEHELWLEGLDAGTGALYESCYERDDSDAWSFYADDVTPEKSSEFA